MGKSDSAGTICGAMLGVIIAGGIVAAILTILLMPPTETIPEFVLVESPSIGNIRGSKSVQGPAIFAGIPYSQPPVGDLRWKRPQPTTGKLHAANSYFDATFARPACPQICSLPSPQYSCPTEMSEDCLHLSVYVPSHVTSRQSASRFMLKPAANLPVMVFMHGGAFIAGSNGVPLYDGRFLSETGDVIVVVVNYRLGPFGFFYQNSGNDDAALGNFGIWDQIEALRWVRDNIQHFGGNPASVTIFGQSAGGQSVVTHLVNEVSDPLFHRAIVESAPFGITYKTKDEAQQTADNFVRFNGKCQPNEMACLRHLTVDEILVTLNNFSVADQFNPASLSQIFEPWAPIIDEVLLHEHPYYTFEKGENQNKPIINGATKDEGMFFVIQIIPEPTAQKAIYTLMLRLIFGDETTESIQDHYGYICRPNTANCDYRIPINDVVTDYMFTCPSRQVFTKNRDYNTDMWWYTFTETWSFPQFWEEYKACYNLSCHSEELPYLFKVDTLTEFRFSPTESYLANTLIRYWSNFARSGNPNTASPTTNDRNTDGMLTYWPRMFEGSTSTELSYNLLDLYGDGPSLRTDGLREDCDFWDEVGLYMNDSVKIGMDDPQFQQFVREQDAKL